MTSESSRKRKFPDLLNDEQDSSGYRAAEPPTNRSSLASSLSTPEPSRSTTHSAGQPDSDSHSPAYLPYPNTSDHTIKPLQIPFQQPSELITFSYTPDHVQVFDDSALRYFVEPPIGSNLGYGYDRWIRKPDQRGRIDALLKAILKVKNDSLNGILPQIGVVAWRGIMTKILTAPYENRDGWELNVMFIDGTLYLEEHSTEERLREKNNMDARQRSQTYYGYAFESYCTTEPKDRTPGNARDLRVPPGWGGDVDTNVQWCSVVRTKLGDTRMIIGGEVDCVRGKYTGKTDTFVELKTSLTIRGQHDERKFERKLLKFYFQSFLLGVPEIVVGFRTPAGIVSTVQSFKTIQLPRLVRGKPEAWDPLLCLDWGQRFLTFLKDSIRSATQPDHDLSNRVWRAKFVPGSGVSVEELEPAAVEDVVNGEDRAGFLSRWYLAEVDCERQPGKATASPSDILAKAGWQI